MACNISTTILARRSRGEFREISFEFADQSGSLRWLTGAIPAETPRIVKCLLGLFNDSSCVYVSRISAVRDICTSLGINGIYDAVQGLTF